MIATELVTLNSSVQLLTLVSLSLLLNRFHESFHFAFGASGVKIELLESVDVDIDVQNVMYKLK